MSNQAAAHQFNLDVAQRELDRRNAEGEDVSHLRVNPRTAAIELVAQVQREAVHARVTIANDRNED